MPTSYVLVANEDEIGVIAHLLKNGNNLRLVQVFVGHKRAASIEAYQLNGLERLKAVIDKLHPLL